MIKTLKYIDLKYLKFIFSEIGKIDLINEFPSVCIRISLRFKKKERVSVIEFVYLWSESFDTINWVTLKHVAMCVDKMSLMLWLAGFCLKWSKFNKNAIYM